MHSYERLLVGLVFTPKLFSESFLKVQMCTKLVFGHAGHACTKWTHEALRPPSQFMEISSPHFLPSTSSPPHFLAIVSSTPIFPRRKIILTGNQWSVSQSLLRQMAARMQ